MQTKNNIHRNLIISNIYIIDKILLFDFQIAHLAHSLAATASKCQHIISQMLRNLGSCDAVVWHAVVIFIIVTGLRTQPPVAVGSGGSGLEGEVGWSTAPAKGTSKAQTVELSSQCKLSASVCSGLNTVAAYYNTSNPGTPASAKCIIALNRCWCWRSLSVYFTVITRAYDALSQHAHSCSVVKWENLSALKTLKAPSVSSPEPTHCLCTIYKHKRRRRNRIHLAPKNLCFSSPRFWQKPRFPVPVRFLSQH